MFWAVAIALALVVAALIVLALLRPAAQTGADTADVRIYRDQLDEVEREVARGTLDPGDAARARTEVSRRLLEADRAAREGGGARRAPRVATWMAAAVSALVVLGGAIGIYSVIGAPGYPDLPLQARIEMADAARRDRPRQDAAEASAADETARVTAEAMAAADPSFLALMDRLRTALAERPDDLEGHRLLARNEAGLNRFAAAAAAQTRVIELKGDTATPEEFTDLAEYLIYAAGGYVSPEAEAALTRALQGDTTLARARFYTGVLYAQTGRPDLTFRLWRDLLARGPEDAPWIAPIRARIDDIAQLAGVRRYTQPEPRGPSAADMNAMADLAPEDRRAAIEGMVANLSDRLAREGGPPQDWARLVVSLSVLGQDDRATAILDEAQNVFADDPDAAELLRDAGVRAGLTQ